MTDLDGTKITVEEFVKQVKENIEEDEDGFYNRIEEFRSVVFDYNQDPTNFTIMGDAFLSFYVLPHEQEQIWLKGCLEQKRQIIYEMMDLEELDVIIKRILYVTDMMKFTSLGNPNPVYNLATCWLFYVVSGFEGFLTEMAMSYYKLPPRYDTKKEIKVPKNEPLDMFQ